MRKTDDNQILQLLREGKSQAEIARTLGVSAVAIHKRLKRIITKPESLDRLTPKEQKFALAVAEGKSRISACMEAFDVASRESAKALQNTLMQKDDIKIAISELMRIYGLTRGYRIHRLKSHVDNIDPVVSLKALDLSWKLDGSYETAKNETTCHEIFLCVVHADGRREKKKFGTWYSDGRFEEPLTNSNEESIGSQDNVIDLPLSLHPPAVCPDSLTESKQE